MLFVTYLFETLSNVKLVDCLKLKSNGINNS